MTGAALIKTFLKEWNLHKQLLLLSSLFSVVIALFLGLTSIFGSKRLDSVVGLLINLCLDVPHLVLMVLISAALGGGQFGVVTAVALTHWPSLTRLIRAEVLQLRSEHYIKVSEMMGKSALFIACGHIFPYVLPVVIVQAVLLFPHTILHGAAVTFLGFGLSPMTPGGITAIVGASESGKSLLAHGIMGILPDNARESGKIVYQNTTLDKEAIRRLPPGEIALIPQSINYLDPLMTVGEQIRRLVRAGDPRAVQEDIFRRYGLDLKAGGLYPFQISGGMARRVLITSAVVQNPTLIIADEPTPGLDEDLVRETLWGEMFFVTLIFAYAQVKLWESEATAGGERAPWASCWPDI